MTGSNPDQAPSHGFRWFFAELCLCSVLVLSAFRLTASATSTTGTMLLLLVGLALGLVPRLHSLHRGLPFVAALAAAYVAQQSAVWDLHLPVPALESRLWAPGVVLGILAGVTWAVSRSQGDRWFDLTLCVTALSFGLWSGVTTWVVAGRGLADAPKNAGLTGQCLFLILLGGGTYSVTSRSRGAAVRQALVLIVVLVMGLVRVRL